MLKKHVTPFIQESLESYKNHFYNNKGNDSFDETKVTEIIKNEVKHIQESIKGLQTTIHQLPFEQKLEETVKKLKDEWNGKWKEHASNIENIEKKSLHMEVVETIVQRSRRIVHKAGTKRIDDRSVHSMIIPSSYSNLKT